MDPMSFEGIVILGGGLAAVRTAQGLRALGYTEPIQLYTEENYPPYDRPPLSKDYLIGAIDDAGLQLLSTQASHDLDLDIRLRARAVRLDRGRRLVEFADGSRTGYDRLVVATGARARLLAGLNPSDRIHYLRTVDDARALARALARAKRLIVVGSGFIGLEVASSARQLGIDVEVVAADAGPMVGIVGAHLSRWLTQVHRDNGVTVTSGVTIADVHDGLSDVGVITSDNAVRRGDVVVVGAGVARDLDWLAMAGLVTDRGLVCDTDGRTNDPSIFGVGDIVCKQDQFGREPIGHWTAAADSARRAAHALAGAEPPVDKGDGFFWTEQHGHRLQFVGTAAVDANLHVRSGSLAEGKFVAELVAPGSGAVTGVFASNSPRDFLKRRLAFHSTVPAVTEQVVAS